MNIEFSHKTTFPERRVYKADRRNAYKFALLFDGYVISNMYKNTWFVVMK